MLEVLKTRAKNETYNVGYKEQIELYDQVAVCPDYYIAVAETMCNVDKAQGLMEDPEKDGTLAETWAVMDHYIETRNNWICTEYPEYKTISRRSECIIQEQRTTRSKKVCQVEAMSPSAKDSQVAVHASLSPTGTRKASSLPGPKDTRQASSLPSPKGIRKVSPLPKNAQSTHRCITRGALPGSLPSSFEHTRTPPALRPASARRMSSSSSFSTIVVARVKVRKTRGFFKK